MKSIYTFKKIFVFTFLMLVFSSTFLYSFELIDDAKQIVDDFYLHSQNNDVDSYVELFDENYIVSLYGDDYKEFFEEVFTYSEILDYDLDFHEYTYSSNSLSFFFTLNSNVIIEGEEKSLDNDLVAFFNINRGGDIKLRYIMLQSVFIEEMNKETFFRTLISSEIDESLDLFQEAIDEGIIDEDEMIRELEGEQKTESEILESFDEQFEEYDKSFPWFIVLILLILSPFVLLVNGNIRAKVYSNKKIISFKGLVISKYHEFKPIFIKFIKNIGAKLKEGAIFIYENLIPFIVKYSKKTYNYIKPKLISFYNYMKPRVIKYSKLVYNFIKEKAILVYNKIKTFIESKKENK